MGDHDLGSDPAPGVVVVTGASGALGSALVDRHLALGATVVATDLEVGPATSNRHVPVAADLASFHHLMRRRFSEEL